MVKNLAKILFISGMFGILSFESVFAATDPTKDTSKKMRLQTSAVDNITKTEDLYFAWFYVDGENEIPLSLNEVEGDTMNGSPFVKNLTTWDATYEKYGNGVYLAKCVDENGNTSVESIDLLAWDTNGPIIAPYILKPGNEQPAGFRTLEIIASDAEEESTGLAAKPYCVYGPVSDPKLNQYIDAKEKSETNHELTDEQAEELIDACSQREDNEWSDSKTSVIEENGNYILFVKDAACNISHTFLKIENIDVIRPTVSEISAFYYKTDGLGEDALAYNQEIFGKNSDLLYVGMFVDANDNYSTLDELKYTWYKDGEVVKSGIGTEYDDLVISPLSLKEINDLLIEKEVIEPDEQYLADDIITNANEQYNGIYKVVVEDKCENTVSTDAFYLQAFDFTDPTISDMTDSSDQLYTQANTINVKGYSDNIKLAEKPFSYHLKGEEGERTTNSTYVVKENGTYEIDIYDYAGNKSTYEDIISNVDINAPIINSVDFSNNSGTVAVTVSAEDETEPSEKLMYCIASSSNEVKSSENWQSSNVLALVNGSDITSGTYWIGVKDYANNITSQSITVNKEYICGELDTMTPDAILSYIEQNPSSWTNGNVQLTVSLPATINEPQYQFNDNAWQESNKFSFGGNGTVVVRVKDEYGNEYVSSPYIIANIDKTEPTASVEFKDDTHNTIVITGTDNESCVDKVTWLYWNDSEEQTPENLKEVTILDVLESDKTEITAEHSIPKLGTYIYRVYDNVGNYKETSITVIAATSKNPYLTSDEISDGITLVPANTWTNDIVSATLSLPSYEDIGLGSIGSESPSHGENYAIQRYYTEIDEATGDQIQKSDERIWSSSRTFTISDNGTYVFSIRDRYGNIINSEPKNVANIDKVTPTITLSLNDSQNKIHVNCSDDASNIQRITVQTVGGTVPETTLTDIRDTEHSSVEFDYSVPIQDTTYLFYVYDNAGNLMSDSVSIGTAKTDNENLNAETIAQSVIPSTTDWTRNPILLTLALGSTSELDATPYSWDEGETWTTSKTHTVTENGIYHIIIKDKYGNNYPSADIVIENIDVVEPTISASVNENGNKATLSVADDYSTLSKIVVTKPDGTSVAIKEYSTVDTLDDAVDYLAPTQDSYTFTVFDKAGNSASTSVDFSSAITDNEELTAENLAASIMLVPDSWSNSTLNLHLSLSNTEDLAENPYRWFSEDSDDNCEYLTEYTTEKTVTINKNGFYGIIVKDKYGNEIQSNSIEVTRFDFEAPLLTYDVDSKGIVSLSATDNNSGVSKITVEGAGYAEETVLKDFSEGVLNAEASFKASLLGTYTVKTYDNAGNSETFSVEVEYAETDNDALSPEELAQNILLIPNVGWCKEGDTKELRLALSNTEGLSDNPFKWFIRETVDTTGGLSTQERELTEYSPESVVTIAHNGLYGVIVKDKYGNEHVSDTIQVNCFDFDAPTAQTATTDAYGYVNIPNITDIPSEINERSSESGLAKVTVMGGNFAEETLLKEFTEFTENGSVTFRALQIGEYTVNIYDNAGNVGTYLVNVESAITKNTELNDPTLLASRISSSANGMEWVAAPVTLSLNLNSFEGLAENAFKWSTQDSYSNNNSVEIYENGEYSVSVKDTYGNENVSKPISINNIDNVVPTLSLSKSTDGTKLHYEASDTQSGIVRILWTGGALSNLTSIAEYLNPCATISGDVPFPNNGTYQVEVYDYCGNVTRDSITVNNITVPNPLLDEEGEGITASIFKSPTTWTNGNVNVSIDMANKTGVDPNGYTWTSEAPVNEETHTFLNTACNRTSIVVTGNGTVGVSVTDEYGHVFNSAPIEINNIDKLAPICTISLNDSQNEIAIEATDSLSGICKITYTFENGEAMVVNAFSSYVDNVHVTIPIKANGNYEVSVYDNAGNVTTQQANVTNATSGVFTDEYISNCIEIENSGYTNETVTLKVRIPEKELLGPAPYSWDGGLTWSYEDEFIVSNNGNYKLQIKDIFGNIYEGVCVVNNIDHVIPTLNARQEGSCLQISAGDNISLAKITLISPDGIYENTLKAYTDTLIYDNFTHEVSKDGEYIVLVYDVAGNKVCRTVSVTNVSQINNNGNSGNSSDIPLLDAFSIYTDGIPSGSSNNASTQAATSSNGGTTTKEYQYNTTVKEKIQVVYNEKLMNNTSNVSQSRPSTTYSTPYQQPVSVTPTPVPVVTASMPTVTPTPVPTKVPTATPTPAVKSSTVTATNSAAKKISSTSSVITTTPTPTPKPATSKVAVLEQKVDATPVQETEESVDAKAMYRNNRVEQTQEKQIEKSNAGKIVFAIIGGLVLIGAGVFGISKYKENKKEKYNPYENSSQDEEV